MQLRAVRQTIWLSLAGIAELYDTNQRKIFLRLKTFLQTTI
ncbi:hypothetical protein QYZ27_04990 [Xanthomonas campestris pv. campestris]|nr:hypothetical protein [Xanthomonas campestris]MEA0778130.1 hypothetical protein [Xanthomonas campestris pv. campestris]MEA0786775.1 hypothetical protein [Xanthomonas campestris pv. campestris]MEA0942112.1 hypothetical protein [Xanthomonas campestris pv. campestris]MEA9836102.1 hypothetical protein [Xanthomonas campestris pv. raphani]MEB1766798.1 hypothetical protein [Xanthomonas campestris pv. campestris]